MLFNFGMISKTTLGGAQSGFDIPFWVILVVLILLILMIIKIYNTLITLKNEVKAAYSQIEVQLKRRHDLIPNLIETVKGYMTHEKETLENVTKARNIAGKISSNAQIQAKNESLLSQALQSLFIVSENYPDLKANQNFLALQEELTTTENRIAFARQYYNETLAQYNIKKEIFPNNMIVGMFNFENFSMFEITNSEERENVKVNFN